MAIPNLENLYNTPDIQNAQAQANQAQQAATNYQSAASLLPTKLKQAIEEKLNYNKDIIDQQAKAQANYFAAPATARSEYQDVFNPFDREKLVAQATANAYAPYQSLTQILGERRGNIADIVNAGTGAFNSQVTAQQGNAQLSRQNYQDQLGLADKLAAIRQWSYTESNKGKSGIADISSLLDSHFTNEDKDIPSTFEEIPKFRNVLEYNKWLGKQK